VCAWRREQSRDRFFREAKRQQYRARSAFKLLELNRRLRLVRPGDAVVDLGAAPGSWSQVLAELVGPGGRVVAADLSPIEPLPGVVTVQADICDSTTADLLAARLGRPADAVVSDVSPQISGNRIADHARSIALADCSLAIARQLSRPGAAFAVKVFQGEDFDAFVGRVRQAYRQARVVVPEATRQESRESYVCGLGRL
jgi:23S rRNA (uridine2552-2'-O)-methyltransferase